MLIRFNSDEILTALEEASVQQKEPNITLIDAIYSLANEIEILKERLHRHEEQK